MIYTTRNVNESNPLGAYDSSNLDTSSYVIPVHVLSE